MLAWKGVIPNSIRVFRRIVPIFLRVVVVVASHSDNGFVGWSPVVFGIYVSVPSLEEMANSWIVKGKRLRLAPRFL